MPSSVLAVTLFVALTAFISFWLLQSAPDELIRECVFFGCTPIDAREFKQARTMVHESDERLASLDVLGVVNLASRRVNGSDTASAVVHMLLERQHDKLCKRCHVAEALRLLEHITEAFPALAARSALQLRKAETSRLLGHEAAAHTAIRAAMSLAASEGENSLPTLADAFLMQGDYAEAFRLYRSAHVRTRAAGGANTDIVSTFKLEHDLAQLEHLGISGPQPAYRAALAALAAMPPAAAALTDPAGRPVLNLGSLRPESVRAQLFAQFNAPHHLPRAYDVWDGDGTLNRAHDFAAHEVAYLAGDIVVIDDFLSPEALVLLHTLSSEATVFNAAMPGGYIGAMHRDGWAPAVLAAVAHELEAALPAVFAGHSLRKWWAFKHDSRHAPDGIFAHADEAAVNVNFWITPDEANIGARSADAQGGLIVYEHHPDDSAFEAGQAQSYHSSSEERARRHEAVGTGRIQRVVPYKANRAVLFSSRKWHATDRHRFEGGLGKHRVNLTLLFGLLAAVQCASSASDVGV